MELKNGAYFGPQDGWKHLQAMKNHKNFGDPIPDETIQFFCTLSLALLDEKSSLMRLDAPRALHNSRLTDTAIEQLKLLKPRRGRVSFEDMTRVEIETSVSYEHAKAVAREIAKNPFLPESTAIENATKIRGTSHNTLDHSVIAKAWRQHRSLFSEITMGTYWHRAEIRASEAIELISKLPIENTYDITLREPFIETVVSIVNTQEIVISKSTNHSDPFELLASCIIENGKPTQPNAILKLGATSLQSLAEQIIKTLGH
jgi:hypothetical protein